MENKITERGPQKAKANVEINKDHDPAEVTLSLNSWHNVTKSQIFKVFVCVIVIYLICMGYKWSIRELDVNTYNKNMIEWKKSNSRLNELSFNVINSTLYKHLFKKDLWTSPIITAIGHPDNIRGFTYKLGKFLYDTLGISGCHVLGRNSDEIKTGFTLQNYISGIVGYKPKDFDGETRRHKLVSCVLLEEPGELPEDTLKTLYTLADNVNGLFPDVLVILGVTSDGTDIVAQTNDDSEFNVRYKRAEMYYQRHLNEKKTVFNYRDALVERLLVNFVMV